MAGFTTAQFEQIHHAVKENAVAFGDALARCLNVPNSWSPGKLQSWTGKAESLSQPGLSIAYQLADEEGLIVAVPESLPLPDWCRNPNEDKQSRLQTLAEEWAKLLLPREIQALQFQAVYVPNLLEDIQDSRPDVQAHYFELAIDSAEVKDGETPAARILVVGPLLNPPLPLADVEDEPSADSNKAGEPGDSRKPVSPASPSSRDAATTLQRESLYRALMKLPVEVTVLLAQRKIELDQLLSVSPGSLITFDKSCEEPLELYINNQLYCRGEAVKIGEKFGMKIDEVGAQQRSPNRVIGS